jgi:hypothetical protein
VNDRYWLSGGIEFGSDPFTFVVFDSDLHLCIPGRDALNVYGAARVLNYREKFESETADMRALSYTKSDLFPGGRFGSACEGNNVRAQDEEYSNEALRHGGD